jgi:hypothetical protein
MNVECIRIYMTVDCIRIHCNATPICMETTGEKQDPFTASMLRNSNELMMMT